MLVKKKREAVKEPEEKTKDRTVTLEVICFIQIGPICKQPIQPINSSKYFTLFCFKGAYYFAFSN